METTTTITSNPLKRFMEEKGLDREALVKMTGLKSDAIRALYTSAPEYFNPRVKTLVLLKKTIGFSIYENL